MKFFIFISALFVIVGCVNKTQQIDYYNTPFPSSGFSIPTVYATQWQPPFKGAETQIECDCCPPLRPPTVYVPSAPSQSIIIPPKPNFIPVMPEESQDRLKMLLTNID